MLLWKGPAKRQWEGFPETLLAYININISGNDYAKTALREEFAEDGEGGKCRLFDFIDFFLQLILIVDAQAWLLVWVDYMDIETTVMLRDMGEKLIVR